MTRGGGLESGRGIFAATATALLLLAMLAGCGGDESTASEPQSKAQYVKQAEAVCAQSHKQLEGEYNEFEKSTPGRGLPSAEEQEEFVESTMIPSLESQLEQVSEVGPPQGSEAQADAYLKTLEGVIDEAASDPSSLVGLKPWQRLNKAAKAAGLRECGQSF